MRSGASRWRPSASPASRSRPTRKSYHLWLTLPPHWRSQTFVSAAARRDIALTPSTTFAVSPGHAPNAVRLALAQPPIEQLDRGLRTLAGMLKAQEEDFEFDRIDVDHSPPATPR